MLLLDDDFEFLRPFIKYDKSNGYWRLHKWGKRVYIHRFVLDAKKGEIVNHINRNKSDNRRSNLRIASHKLNSYNCNVENPLGRGIYFDKHGNRFRACISHNNKTLKLGSFKSARDAKIAYNQKAKEMYGDDAYQHEV